MFLKIRAALLAALSVIVCLNPAQPYKFMMRLSNPAAGDSVVRLYNYICNSFGNTVLSGQQEGFGPAGRNEEFDYIFEASGKLPAIRGFDFVNDDFDGVYERAVEWAGRGGIVTICWHCSKNFDKGYEECISDKVDNWDELLTPGTPENEAFTANMDRAAAVLKKLGENGIPVLWRPFHEFNGSWFWWGGDSGRFVQLWKYMYDHWTYDLGLNNLIWVLGYSELDISQREFFEWYPGKEYCDIIGCDSYHVAEYGAGQRQFEKCMRTAFGSKPVILHECGLIPSAEQLRKTPWVAFMAWHSEYLTAENTPEHIKEIYTSDFVITLDELPVFTS